VSKTRPRSFEEVARVAAALIRTVAVQEAEEDVATQAVASTIF
jgi:hypothetical protein